MHWFLIALLSLCVLLNGVASVAVLRATSMPAGRRALQLALVWLVPLVGAALCLAFAITDKPAHGKALDRTEFGDIVGGDASSGPGLCGCTGAGGGDGD